MKKTLSIFVILFLSTSFLYANSDSIKTKFGIYGGININTHSADFYKLNGIPNCCPNFESGSGIGFNAGTLYEYKLFNNIWFGARLGIITLDGELTKEEPTTIILETGPIDGKFEHKITGSFMNAGFEPSIIYNLFGDLQLSAGARFGMNITKNYDQVETLVEPDGYGTFLDSLGNDTHKRTRNEYSGEIPDAPSFQMLLHGGICYEMPMNKEGSLLLAPEISYYFPITELVENTNWKVNSLRVGIALKYALIPEPPKIDIFKKEMFIDTIKIESEIIADTIFKTGIEEIKTTFNKTKSEKITLETIIRIDTLYYPKIYSLAGHITVVGVDSIGKEIENPVFIIEEFVSNRLDPLLNYVFFEENSSELPDRYNKLSKSGTDDFEIDSLYKEGTLDIYYHILNIVGKRMNLHPDANITLIGCNAGIGKEYQNTELSQNRAETVRDYLINIWNISSNRIVLKNRNLPEKASTPIEEADKIAENRRVEIYSDNDKILEPVFIEKIDMSANPSVARFKPEANSEAGLKMWKIEAWQKTAQKDKFLETGEKSIPANIDWELEKFQKIIPKVPEPILYSLFLEDVKNNDTLISKKTLPIDVITISKKRIELIGDYEVEKFSLILFDFDKSIIEGSNGKITDFILSRIKPESELEIKGYTDRTGDDEYNQKLSERRANSTKDALQRKDAALKGIGEHELLYNNELPEGRFYCRTVQITVKTKK